MLKSKKGNNGKEKDLRIIGESLRTTQPRCFSYCSKPMVLQSLQHSWSSLPAFTEVFELMGAQETALLGRGVFSPGTGNRINNSEHWKRSTESHVIDEVGALSSTGVLEQLQTDSYHSLLSESTTKTRRGLHEPGSEGEPGL